ncbi:MAG: hypothetical protein PHN22_04185 [Candidatus ainarchaeum sp.]|nr:hypothetical protein [Candidatus ainarchaeum sp.]
MRKIISLNFRRHTNKDKEGNATKYGLQKAKEIGKNISKNKVLKGYTSDIKENRCIKTLKEIEKGFKQELGVSSISRKTSRKSIGESIIIRNKEKLYDLLLNKLNGDVIKFYQLWYANKIPKNIILQPKEITDLIVKDRFAHIFRFIRMKSYGDLKKYDVKPIHVENITHDVIVGALLTTLTGKKMTKFSKKYVIKPRQEISFDFYKNKDKLKIMLRYNDFKLDVTSKINNILENK